MFDDRWCVWRAGIDANKTAEHESITENRKHAMRLGKQLTADHVCAIIATPYRA